LVRVLGPVAAGRGWRAWLLPHGFFIGLYTLYGLGNYFVGGIMSPWDLEMLWLLAYGGAASLCLLLSTPFAAACQRWVQGEQERAPNWPEELQRARARALACFGGVTAVFGLTLSAQLALLLVASHVGGVILWPLSFAFLSSAVAGLGTYFYVGYAGMADLHAIDEFLRGRRGGEASDLPRGLIESLSAEMSMLRTVVASLVVLYPSAAIGSLFALDKLPQLFDRPDWANGSDVPLQATIWFIVGVALLLFGAHATVVGPAHGRYYDIARWLQWREEPG
jgi:hypothetical protein